MPMTHAMEELHWRQGAVKVWYCWHANCATPDAEGTRTRAIEIIKDLAQRDVPVAECGKRNTQNGLIALAPLRGEALVLLISQTPEAEGTRTDAIENTKPSPEGRTPP